MTLKQSVTLSLAVAFFVIGVHQTFQHGLAASYWIFMIVIVLLIVYQYFKNKNAGGANDADRQNQT